jgi:hypothetical protein
MKLATVFWRIKKGGQKNSPECVGAASCCCYLDLPWAGCRGGFRRTVFGFRVAGGTRRLSWSGRPYRRARCRSNRCAGGRSDRCAGGWSNRCAGGRSNRCARRWANRCASGWADGGPSSRQRIQALSRLCLHVLGRICCCRTGCRRSPRLTHNVSGQGKTARDRDCANSRVCSLHYS